MDNLVGRLCVLWGRLPPPEVAARSKRNSSITVGLMVPVQYPGPIFLLRVKGLSQFV